MKQPSSSADYDSTGGDCESPGGVTAKDRQPTTPMNKQKKNRNSNNKEYGGTTTASTDEITADATRTVVSCLLQLLSVSVGIVFLVFLVAVLQVRDEVGGGSWWWQSTLFCCLHGFVPLTAEAAAAAAATTASSLSPSVVAAAVAAQFLLWTAGSWSVVTLGLAAAGLVAGYPPGGDPDLRASVAAWTTGAAAFGLASVVYHAWLFARARRTGGDGDSDPPASTASTGDADEDAAVEP